MKKIFFLCFLFLISNSSIAQIVNIPDEIFKDMLVNQAVATFEDGSFGDVDTNDDGEIQVSEAEAVQKLNIGYGLLIESIEGIQSFIYLTELACNYSNITHVDVSQNINLIVLNLGRNLLSQLDVTQNINLEFLIFSNNSITDIDLTQNNNIKTLFCDHNKLTKLNLNEINDLEIIECGDNLLTSLSFSENPKLIHLGCTKNLLSSIDVSQNPLLESFYCSKNQLTNIDVTQNPILRFFNCRHNLLTELDVTQNQNLLSTSFYHNFITQIDVSQNPILSDLTCNDNLITSLDVSHNPLISIIECFNNNIIELNLQNGFNENFFIIHVYNNPNLSCIKVDDVAYANNQECINDDPYSGWCKDEFTSYSEDCSLGFIDLFTSQITLYPNPLQNILNIENTSIFSVNSLLIYDIQGKLLLQEKEQFTSIDLSQLNSGLLFVQLETEQGILTKKMVKE
jgi:hypothetical protein